MMTSVTGRDYCWQMMPDEIPIWSAPARRSFPFFISRNVKNEAGRRRSSRQHVVTRRVCDLFATAPAAVAVTSQTRFVIPSAVHKSPIAACRWRGGRVARRVPRPLATMTPGNHGPVGECGRRGPQSTSDPGRSETANDRPLFERPGTASLPRCGKAPEEDWSNV